MIARWCRYCVTSVHTKITFFSPQKNKGRKTLPKIPCLEFWHTKSMKSFSSLLQEKTELILCTQRVKLYQVFYAMKELQSRGTGDWIFGFFLPIQVGGQVLGTLRWISRPGSLFFAKYSSSFWTTRFQIFQISKQHPQLKAEAANRTQPNSACLIKTSFGQQLFLAKFSLIDTSWISPCGTGLERESSLALQSCHQGLGRLRQLYSNFSLEAKSPQWHYLHFQLGAGAFIPGSPETAQGVINSLKCSKTEPIFSTGLAAANAQAHY